jgi:hypothetical protein
VHVDWGGFSLADETHRGRLTHEIADKGYDLVFGDPLDSLGIEGVGSPENTRKFLALMKQTGLNKSVAWWLYTHPRKEETKEALNEIAGAWGGKPDSVFLLRMLDDDRTQLRQPKLRWARRGKGPTILYAFDPDTEAFAYIGEQADEDSDYLAEIRELLADDEWRTVKEICVGIKAGETAVKKDLTEHPDLFESRTGEEAAALGRRSDATLCSAPMCSRPRSLAPSRRLWISTTRSRFEGSLRPPLRNLRRSEVGPRGPRDPRARDDPRKLSLRRDVRNEPSSGRMSFTRRRCSMSATVLPRSHGSRARRYFRPGSSSTRSASSCPTRPRRELPPTRAPRARATRAAACREDSVRLRS